MMLFEKSAKFDPFDANAVENLRWVANGPGGPLLRPER